MCDALADSGSFVVREKYNCAKRYSRDILRDAYRGLGADDLYPAELYSDTLIEEEMRSLHRADMIFCPSPMVAHSLQDCGVDEGRLAMTSYGFDPSRLDGDSKALPPADGPTFLFTGYICVRKGAHILLEAWRSANIRGRLVLLGQLEPFIAERYADILARDDVEHHAFSPDVGSYYRSADCFIFPSLEEGSPLVTYEAAYCGLPSLVTAMGAGPIVRDGIEGTVDRWGSGGRMGGSDSGRSTEPRSSDASGRSGAPTVTGFRLG